MLTKLNRDRIGNLILSLARVRFAALITTFWNCSQSYHHGQQTPKGHSLSPLQSYKGANGAGTMYTQYLSDVPALSTFQFPEIGHKDILQLPPFNISCCIDLTMPCLASISIDNMGKRLLLTFGSTLTGQVACVSAPPPDRLRSDLALLATTNLTTEIGLI